MKKAFAFLAIAIAATGYAKIKLSGTVDRWNNGNGSFPFEVRVDKTTIPGKAIHWYSDGHSVTVTPHRVDSIRLTNTVDIAVIRIKKHKNDYDKAVKKDKKNVEKAVKELIKLKEKSSDEVAALFQDAIDVFEGR